MNADEAAFPIVLEHDHIWDYQQGLTKREHIAALMMQSIIAAETDEQSYADVYVGLDGKETFRKSGFPLLDGGTPDYSKDEIDHKLLRSAADSRALEAIKNADALIAELNKPKTENAS